MYGCSCFTLILTTVFSCQSSIKGTQIDELSQVNCLIKLLMGKQSLKAVQFIDLTGPVAQTVKVQSQWCSSARELTLITVSVKICMACFFACFVTGMVLLALLQNC